MGEIPCGRLRLLSLMIATINTHYATEFMMEIETDQSHNRDIVPISGFLLTCDTRYDTKRFDLYDRGNMKALTFRHLMTLTLDVNFAGITDVGPTPGGRRRIAPVTGGSFAGDRLSGRVLGGDDWVINRPDGAMVVDVRLALSTADGVSIYLTYGGVFKAAEDVMKRFKRGETLSAEEFTLRITPRFECGHERYSWLNDMLCAGAAEQLPTGPRYTIYEIA